ncbi:hypothetical protein MMC29_008059, partial [Sticta canariensis]|nr:hypothetical protein [Sticta canariensis]
MVKVSKKLVYKWRTFFAALAKVSKSGSGDSNSDDEPAQKKRARRSFYRCSHCDAALCTKSSCFRAFHGLVPTKQSDFNAWY